MKEKIIDSSLLEAALLYLSRYELYEAQLAFASIRESLGMTNEMMLRLLGYLGLKEAELRREGLKIRGEIEASGLDFISIVDEDYPVLLKQIAQPPLILFYKGNLAVLRQKALSVVGTRKPSFDGIRACDVVIANLAKHFKKLSIVSGLALGVDSLVHKASIKCGLSAVSVLPSSVNAPTPVSNIYLAEQILAHGGLLLSEKFPGHTIKSYSYIERNRIISGLSTKTLIIEAALKSGSMATAKLALEQGRDVYAMPGSLSNPVAEGCNYLISMGAYPLYRLDALLEDDEFRLSEMEEFDEDFDLEPKYKGDEVLKLIRSRHSLDLDSLVAEVSIPESELLSRLIEYEMDGIIAREGEDIIALK